MNKALADLSTRIVQASVLAFMLWVGRVALQWPWLGFIACALVGYAVICTLYALFWWWLNHGS